MFSAVALAAGLLVAGPAAAQDSAPTAGSPLPQLLAERKALTDRYTAASAQRHSLFGNKPSKKDLQEVVDALQGIVDKDQQIVDVLNRTAQAATTTSARLAATTTSLENTGRDDRNLTVKRLSELENETQNLKERERQRLIKVRDLEAEIAESKQGRFWRDSVIGALVLVCGGLLLARSRRK